VDGDFGEGDIENIPEKDRKQFERAARSGQLRHLVPPWVPWWRGQPEASKTVHGSSFPSLFSLSKKPAPAVLQFHAVDLIYSYVLMALVYNGDWSWDITGAPALCLQVSGVLEKNENPLSAGTAILNCMSRAVQPPILSDASFVESILDDVRQILESKAHVFRAFSELKQLFHDATHGGKSRRDNSLNRSEKKLYFFLVWCNEQSDSDIKNIQWEVDQFTSEYTVSKKGKPTKSRGRVLIEPVP